MYMQRLLIVYKMLIFTTVKFNKIPDPKKSVDPSILAAETKILSLHFSK